MACATARGLSWAGLARRRVPKPGAPAQPGRRGAVWQCHHREIVGLAKNSHLARCSLRPTLVSANAKVLDLPKLLHPTHDILADMPVLSLTTPILLGVPREAQIGNNYEEPRRSTHNL